MVPSELLVFVIFVVASASALQADSCNLDAVNSCADASDVWTQGRCNSVHGGIQGNTQNLVRLMNNHLTDSFKMLIMANHFSSDSVNRLGFHRYVRGYSDKMWKKGKSLMKYLLKRGGQIGDALKIGSLQLEDYQGEVKVLSVLLDMMKQQAENSILSYKHALNKNLHEDDPTKRSFDPAAADFLSDNFAEEYADDIREIAGRINVLGKITKNDKTKNMGLYLYDQSLVQ